jgi:hypothetical protein
MELSNVSMDALSALMAGKRAEIASQLSVNVLREQLDEEKQQGESLVQMMRQTAPSVDGRGAIVDRYA